MSMCLLAAAVTDDENVTLGQLPRIPAPTGRSQPAEINKYPIDDEEINDFDW